MDESKVKKENNLVEIVIDPEMTDGGIRVNEVLYVGRVKVPRDQAEDLMRIQSEYFETKKKLSDPSSKIRIKNDLIVERLFVVDPRIHGSNPHWTRENGLVDPWQMRGRSEKFLKIIKERRMALYGY